jgi:hypothetical protein
MQYSSPLYVFADKPLTDINDANLEKWQKLLSSETGSNTESTISIDGKTYNKLALQNAIQLLQTDRDFHFQIFKNKPLLAFLEKGDTAIFQENGMIKELENADFKEKIKPYLVYRFNQIYYESATQPGFQSIQKLKDIRESGFKMPADFEQPAYEKAHQYLENYVAEGIENLGDPFQPGNKRLKKEAVSFFELHTLNVFKNLPDYFSKIKERYGILAHNYVVQVLRKFPVPENTSRPVARVLLNACRIDAELRDDPQAKRLVPLFERVMAQKEVKTKKFVGGSWKGWIGFVGVICFLLFFGMCGDLPAQFKKEKSPYQKSVDRYNYYRNKKPEKRVQRKGIKQENLRGSWRADLFIDKARIFRTLHFYTPSIGKSVYQFVTVNGEEQCRLTAWFYWEVDDSFRNSKFNLLRTRHRGEIIVEGDVSSLPAREREVLDNVKSRMEKELYEEVIKFDDDDYFELVNRKYYQEEDAYEVADLPVEVQQRIQETQQYELDLISAGNEIGSSFERDSTNKSNANFNFRVTVMDNELLLDNKKIGMVELTPNGHYFQPWNWTKGRGYRLEGVFKNVNFKRNGEFKTGDLEMLYGYRKGYRFRELGELPAEKPTDKKKKK